MDLLHRSSIPQEGGLLLDYGDYYLPLQRLVEGGRSNSTMRAFISVFSEEKTKTESAERFGKAISCEETVESGGKETPATCDINYCFSSYSHE
jgi:hypothetical protein